eukprot:COSAG06_NODE_35292_length_461_cov_55.223757_1_plen_33_part_10
MLIKRPPVLLAPVPGRYLWGLSRAPSEHRRLFA